jgi:ABC-type branched-subunit amino acid transport system substrate-binding protein
MRFLWAIAISFALVNCSKIGAQNNAQAPEISLGVIFPLSKTSSTFGTSLKQGLLLALSERFGEPEIDGDDLIYSPSEWKGVRIHLHMTDDQAVPQIAQRLAADLLVKHKAVLLIGSGNSNCTARVRDVGPAANTPVLGPMSSATRLTTRSTAGHFFRLQATDSSKMAVLAWRLVKVEKVMRLAIFYEDDEWYGEGLRDNLVTSITKACFHFGHSRLTATQQPINVSKSGFWIPALQSQELLAKGEIFQQEVTSRAEAASKQTQQKPEHSKLYSRRR